MENKEIILEISSETQFVTLNDILSEYKTYLKKNENEFVKSFELDNISCSFNLFETSGTFPILKTKNGEIIEGHFVFNNTKQRTFENLEKETSFKLVFNKSEKAEEFALGFYNHLKNYCDFIFGPEFAVNFNLVLNPLSNVVDKSYNALEKMEFRIENEEKILINPLTKYNHDQIWEIVNTLGISINYETNRIYWKGKGNDLMNTNNTGFTYARILHKGDLAANLEVFIDKFVEAGYMSKDLLVKYADIVNGNYSERQGEKKLKEIQENKMNYKFYYIEEKEGNNLKTVKVLERSVNVNPEINKEIEKELENNKKLTNSNNKNLKV